MSFLFQSVFFLSSYNQKLTLSYFLAYFSLSFLLSLLLFRDSYFLTVNFANLSHGNTSPDFEQARTPRSHHGRSSIPGSGDLQEDDDDEEKTYSPPMESFRLRLDDRKDSVTLSSIHEQSISKSPLTADVEDNVPEPRFDADYIRWKNLSPHERRCILLRFCCFLCFFLFHFFSFGGRRSTSFLLLSSVRYFCLCSPLFFSSALLSCDDVWHIYVCDYVGFLSCDLFFS